MTTGSVPEGRPSSPRISRAVPRARSSARLVAASAPPPEPRLSTRALLGLAAGALAALVLVACLFLRPGAKAPAALAKPPPRTVAARDPEAPRRYRGTVGVLAEDGRGFRLTTSAGAADVRFKEPLALELRAGQLVDVEGRMEGPEPEPGAPPGRLRASLLKVLPARR